MFGLKFTGSSIIRKVFKTSDDQAMYRIYRIQQQVSQDIVPHSCKLEVGQVEGVTVEGVHKIVLENELSPVGHVDVPGPQEAETVPDQPGGTVIVVIARVVARKLQVLEQ